MGGRSGQIIEDKLDHFCRGLDALCEKHKFRELDLLSLTQDADKTKIKEMTSKARKVIDSVRKRARNSGDTAQSSYLQTAIGNLSNVFMQRNKFGKSVCELLRKFRFPDADILDIYISSNPRLKKYEDWAGLLSHYRGRVIHVGYFNLRTKEHEIRDIDAVTLHLHDILVRILFTILGYDGKYGPIMRGPSYEEPLNWVQPDTTARELGYK